MATTSFRRPKSKAAYAGTRRLLPLALFPIFAMAAASQWQPLSSTAIAITGPITLTNTQLTMARHTFPLQLSSSVDTAHLADAAKITDFYGRPASAALFKLHIPASTTLLNANTICGNEPTSWLLAVYGHDGLSLAFFSGAAKPPMDASVVNNGHNLCGTFSYTPAK